MHKILMIIAPEKFRDEEYFEPKTIFEEAGYDVVTASTKVGVINGSHGGSACSDITIDQIDDGDYDTVVFVGGQGSYAFDTNKKVQAVALRFADSGKFVNAICHAPIIIAKAGLLAGKNATVHSGDTDELNALGVHYTGENVTQDGRIITADGPHSATEFGDAIITALAAA